MARKNGTKNGTAVQFNLQSFLRDMQDQIRSDLHNMHEEQKTDLHNLRVEQQGSMTALAAKVDGFGLIVNTHETRIQIVEGTRRWVRWLAVTCLGAVVVALVQVVFKPFGG